MPAALQTPKTDIDGTAALHSAHRQPKRHALHHVQQHQHQHVGCVLDQGAILQVQQAAKGHMSLWR